MYIGAQTRDKYLGVLQTKWASTNKYQVKKKQ